MDLLIQVLGDEVEAKNALEMRKNEREVRKEMKLHNVMGDMSIS